MDSVKIQTVVNQYFSELHSRGCVPSRGDTGLGEDNNLDHVMWMCTEIPRHLDAGKIEKAHRWLGFIQGVLWASEVYTIENMRIHNRSGK